MMLIVATNVIARRLAKHRPTGMPTAHANYTPNRRISVRYVKVFLVSILMKVDLFWVHNQHS